jgi:NAD(P)-dependent dehydrogenase (short-subunit alcohol dehydrogenase family)
VLVTGASTGIGEATAMYLQELGFEVLAGVRRDADADRLRESGLTPLMLDVTDPAHIDRILEVIGDSPLSGLVNNAGVGYGGPLEFLPIEDLRRQLEVNVVGQVAVTQACIGPLCAGHGRIVNVSSIAGRLALPLLGAYAASKFALEGLSDALRRELVPYGVDVIVVEPGGVKTPMWAKSVDSAERLRDGAPPDLETRYGKLFSAMVSYSEKLENTGIEVGVVAATIGKALTARRPRTRYLIGRDAKIRGSLAGILPDRLMDRMILRTLSA